MQYLHKFNTTTEYTTARNNNYSEPWVSYTEDTGKVDYNNLQLANYLTFDVVGGGRISLKIVDDGPSISKTIEYSINDNEWTTLTVDGPTPKTISVNSGDKVRFRGDNSSYANEENDNISYMTFGDSTCVFNLKGNIMSLISSTNFDKLKTLTEDCTFYYLFNKCSGLRSAANLNLPATTLTKMCYSHIFEHTGINEAPVLPASKLGEYCYDGLFGDCPSLTNIPINYLTATNLEAGCYQGMFYGTSITTAPTLFANVIKANCYTYMFGKCKSLINVPANYLPATTLAQGCYQSMFSNCESLTQAPELPATTLVQGCYAYMFIGCKNLNYIKCLATDISATDCTNYWITDVPSTGTFVKNSSMTSWKTGNNGIPKNWTVQNA